MYLKKHTVLQKLFSEKYHWSGGTSSQDAKSSIWYKHKLTAWWRHNLMQLWEAYAWDVVTPHILQCCRDFFFSQENVIWNIFTTELNRDCEIEQALLICLSFLVNILLVFFVLFCFFLVLHQLLSVHATSMPSMWRMHNKPYFFKKKKKDFLLHKEIYLPHQSL